MLSSFIRATMNPAAVTRNLQHQARRAASSPSMPHVKTLPQAFLNDPSVYPLIIILGSTLAFMTGMGIHALKDYKDVQIRPSKRNSPLQDWGYEEQHKWVEDLSIKRKFLSFGMPTYSVNSPEGLGINHEEWKKEKDEYMKKHE